MPPVETQPIPPTTPKKTFRILYADDMAELRRLMELSLARDGHRVATVPDGRPALELIRADPNAFDIVITDHHMVDLNGLELVGRLREVGFPGKIIVFSSELSPRIGDAYRDLKVDAVLFKPVMPGVLRHLLQEL